MTDPAFRPVESLRATAYIVKRCDEKGIALNVTKLQKLMFCCYGTVLGKFGLRLIDEYPVAWQYGPVFSEALRSVQFFRVPAFLDKGTPDADALPEGVRKLIDETLDVFGKFTARQLSDWTRLKGSPWDLASDGGASLFGRLSDRKVGDYFKVNVLR